VRVRLSLLASVAALGVGGGAGAAASTHAALRLADRQPAVLNGRFFHARELVRVTLEAQVTRVKWVRAGSSGAFTVVFTGTNVPRCGGAYALARGAQGSFATLKIPALACQPE
jgi:hypothetical protein